MGRPAARALARRAVPLWVAGALGAAGCSDPLPSRALVDDLRVLGVRAEPPEAAPGTTIVFDALVGDVEVPARPFRRGWAICTPGESGVATCGDPERVAVLGTGVTASWDVPADFLEDLSPEDASLGRDVYVVLGVELDGLDRPAQAGEHDVAFKRVRISRSASPNANPSVDRLVLDGMAAPGPLPVEGGTRLRLDAAPGTGSAESYRLNGKTVVEELRYTWLVTGGSIADPVTWGDDDGGESSTRWRVPDPGGVPEAMVWVVLRDGRGGTAWASQVVSLE